MKDALVHLRAAVERLYQNLIAAEQGAEKIIAGVHPKQQQSATNLIHYLALRCEDLRALQDELHVAGLSSLASSESHILRQLKAVLQRLGANFPGKNKAITFESGTKLLDRRATTLFGHKKTRPFHT